MPSPPEPPGRLPARPGEVCAHHPDCCWPEEDCAGCGAPAIGAAMVGGVRVPFCHAHSVMVLEGRVRA
jgi:hypothetical protein